MNTKIRLRVNHKKLKRQPIQDEKRGDKERKPAPKKKRNR